MNLKDKPPQKQPFLICYGVFLASYCSMVTAELILLGLVYKWTDEHLAKRNLSLVDEEPTEQLQTRNLITTVGLIMACFMGLLVALRGLHSMFRGQRALSQTCMVLLVWLWRITLASLALPCARLLLGFDSDFHDQRRHRVAYIAQVVLLFASLIFDLLLLTVLVLYVCLYQRYLRRSIQFYQLTTKVTARDMSSPYSIGSVTQHQEPVWREQLRKISNGSRSTERVSSGWLFHNGASVSSVAYDVPLPPPPPPEHLLSNSETPISLPRIKSLYSDDDASQGFVNATFRLRSDASSVDNPGESGTMHSTIATAL